MNAPPRGFIHSLRGLSGSLLALVANRVELASTELELAMRLLVVRVLWLLAAVLLGFLCIIVLSILVLVALWETHRVAAALGLAALYLGGAALAWYKAVSLGRRVPGFLAGTIAELRADLSTLTGGSNDGTAG